MLAINFLSEIGGPASSDVDSVVDVWGHVGGAIVGLMWGLGFFPRVKTSVSAKLRLAGMVFTVGFFVLGTLGFFIFRHP